MKEISGWIAGFVIVWLGYNLIGSVFYTYKLAEFYDVDYSVSEYGVALNGRSGFDAIIGGSKLWGDVISPKDIAADFELRSDAGGVEAICSDVITKRSNLTVSAVGYDGDIACCWLTNEEQFLVPYKDIDGVRHYMCGSWPYVDHVMQPIAKSKLAAEKAKSEESVEGY